MDAVVLEGVNKVYDGGVRAVSDFNLDIAHGEFLVLVGPSGCGKSTTLRMIAGLEDITSGTIKIGDRVVNDVPPKDRDIAMVFQTYALYPHMSVYDNMSFGLKLRRFKKAEIDRRVRDAAGVLGISDLLERRPKQLSGGQRQRVAVGRAIVRKPKVFLFDEPLSNLDAKMRVQMRVEIGRLHNHLKTTMIYVTHDQSEAMTMGDRIVVMKDGLTQQVSTPVALYDHPVNKFVAGFIGTPPMNFFDGRIVKNGDLLSFESGGFNMPLPDAVAVKVCGYVEKSITLGLRPEDIGSRLAEEDNSAPRIEAVVDVIEPMGSDTFVYLNMTGKTFVARVDSHHLLKVGEQVNLGQPAIAAEQEGKSGVSRIDRRGM